MGAAISSSTAASRCSWRMVSFLERGRVGSFQAPADAQNIELGDSTILPGFIDGAYARDL